ncbi:MAG: hypothetical protein R3F65_10310 [bacterium]
MAFDARDDLVGVLCFSARDGEAAGVLSRALGAAGLMLWGMSRWRRGVLASAGGGAGGGRGGAGVGVDASGWRDEAVQARVAGLGARGARVVVARLPGAVAPGWTGGLGAVVEVDDPAAPTALVEVLRGRVVAGS